MNDRATSTAAIPAAQPATGVVARYLDGIGKATSIPFHMVRADGSVYRNSDAVPAFTLVFKTRRAEGRVLRYGHIGMLESYFDGDAGRRGRPRARRSRGFESGFDMRAEPLVRAAQSVARVPLLEPHASRRPRPTRASTTALASRLLPALARRAADDVHLRLLEAEGTRRSRRRRATRSTTCAARCGSRRGETRRRHRLRLRRLHVPRLRAIRRARSPASTPRPSRSSGCARRSRAAA